MTKEFSFNSAPRGRLYERPNSAYVASPAGTLGHQSHSPECFCTIPIAGRISRRPARYEQWACGPSNIRLLQRPVRDRRACSVHWVELSAIRTTFHLSSAPQFARVTRSQTLIHWPLRQGESGLTRFAAAALFRSDRQTGRLAMIARGLQMMRIRPWLVILFANRGAACHWSSPADELTYLGHRAIGDGVSRAGTLACRGFEVSGVQV